MHLKPIQNPINAVADRWWKTERMANNRQENSRLNNFFILQNFRWLWKTQEKQFRKLKLNQQHFQTTRTVQKAVSDWVVSGFVFFSFLVSECVCVCV